MDAKRVTQKESASLARPAGDKVVAAYVVDQALPSVTADDARHLTHLLIAFGHIVKGLVQADHLQHLDCLPMIRQANPSLRIMLSIGGWGAGGFSEAASSENSRRQVAASAVDIMIRLGLDGLDLDWEYPCYAEAGIAASPADKMHFTKLIRAFRDALDQAGQTAHRRYLLTIAAGADQYYLDGTEMDQVQSSLDLVQLMTYDMRGGFQTLTGHHTNLYTSTGDLFRISADASVRMFHQAGVPLNKIVIGSAFYARKWQNVPDINHGLHQMTPSFGAAGGGYGELVDQFINKSGFQRFWDDEAKAPWLFNGDTFISYDDPESIRHKCAYVRQQGLAGIMYWQHGSDPTHTLLEAMAKAIQG